MAEGAVSYTRKLESDEAFKQQFEDMCAAGGDAGAEVKRLFAAVSERASKKVRAEPYAAGQAPAGQQPP